MDFWPWYKIQDYWADKQIAEIVKVLILLWLGAIGEKWGSFQKVKEDDHWEGVHWDDLH